MQGFRSASISDKPNWPYQVTHLQSNVSNLIVRFVVLLGYEIDDTAFSRSLLANNSYPRGLFHDFTPPKDLDAVGSTNFLFDKGMQLPGAY